jgi:glycosyltransferase involved in cell wall biosynthesis
VPPPLTSSASVRRILLLITDLEIGGTPTVVRELSMRLSTFRPSTEVEVGCLGRRGPVAAAIREAGVRVACFGASGPSDLPRVVAGLVRRVRRRRIDTVFSFLIHANTVAAIASRFVRDVRFFQSIQTTQPEPRWHWWLQRIVHHAAERVVVPSPSAAEVARQWADVPREKILIIPNAVDPALFQPQRSPRLLPPGEAPSAAGQARAEVHVGFVGRLDPVKRIPDLLSALALLEDRFVLHIFGDGQQRSLIESLIDRFGLRDRVTMHGAIQSPEAALRQIDLLVLPSAAEGFGLVLIEAMAAGVPVVATDVAGIRDVVQNEQSGVLVPVASPGTLAEAIRRVAEDHALRARLVGRGLEEVKRRFTWEVVLPRYLSLLSIDASRPASAGVRVEDLT